MIFVRLIFLVVPMSLGFGIEQMMLYFISGSRESCGECIPPPIFISVNFVNFFVYIDLHNGFCVKYWILKK